MVATDVPISEGPLQFGRRDEKAPYRDRPCAYGVLPRPDGLIALVKISRPEVTYYDLPGGALDPGEDDATALIREFGEETGLRIEVSSMILRARQYMLMKDGAPVNNISGLYRVALIAEEPALKVEEDHALVWRSAAESVRILRHDSHAWAVAAWLRSES